MSSRVSKPAGDGGLLRSSDAFRGIDFENTRDGDAANS